jgi:tRNA-2-methylthio-N6-dimethylallyladenosine synthase
LLFTRYDCWFTDRTRIIKTLEFNGICDISFGYIIRIPERQGTLCWSRKMEDDTVKLKLESLQEIVDMQQKHAWLRSEEFMGQEVLVEKYLKNQPVFWKKLQKSSGFPLGGYKIGDFVNVKCKVVLRNFENCWFYQ